MHFIARHRLELVVAAACFSLLGYFAWQGLHGPRSLHTRTELSARLAQLNLDFSQIQTQRLNLETRVSQMRPGSVDADLVDELARASLNMGDKTELVVHFAN